MDDDIGNLSPAKTIKENSPDETFRSSRETLTDLKGAASTSSPN